MFISEQGTSKRYKCLRNSSPRQHLCIVPRVCCSPPELCINKQRRRATPDWAEGAPSREPQRYVDRSDERRDE